MRPKWRVLRPITRFRWDCGQEWFLLQDLVEILYFIVRSSYDILTFVLRHVLWHILRQCLWTSPQNGSVFLLEAYQLVLEKRPFNGSVLLSVVIVIIIIIIIILIFNIFYSWSLFSAARLNLLTAERLSRLLERFGLSASCLSQSGTLSLNTIVNVSLVLGVHQPSDSAYVSMHRLILRM